MLIAHHEGVIVAAGPTRTIEADYIDVITDIPPRDLLESYKIHRGELVRKDAKRPNGDMRVALVAPFQVPCGISTYSEYLFDALKPLVGEVHVFAEREEGALANGDVTRCWDKGAPLTNLHNAIEAWDPDVVLIQMEYGYFPEARHFLSLMGALSHRRVVTTLHSVYTAHHDKTIVEAACPEIVVHTEAARDALQNVHGVSGKVTVIPHGCLQPSEGRLWNLYGTPHTILQFGFGFPYKGWEHAIETVATLKGDYPDVFYTGLVSERWSGSTKDYVRELNRLAKKLGVAENVGLIRGFQSDTALDAYLRTNSVALFPYRDNGDHAVLGCSGAARVAMSRGLPVVAADVPLFDDLEGIVRRPTTVEGWANAVRDAFENPLTHVDAQNRFLETNSWPKVAKRYVEVLFG